MRRKFKQFFFIFQKFVSAVLYPLYSLINYFSIDNSIPVLMYHKICNMPCESTDVRYDNVSVHQFEKQMKYLHKNGYHVISLDHYLKWKKKEKEVPKKSVVITFDDGYKNVYLNAFPILKKYNFPAAVFLAANYTGTDKIFDWLKWDQNALADKEKHVENWLPLLWKEAREMSYNNISIGSHTLSHPHLAKLDVDKIKNEVRESKQKIEEGIKKKVRFFSYPVGIKQYGAFSDITKKELIASEYDIAFISEIGRNKRRSDPYTQKRIAITEHDSLFDLKCKLVGAYDWVGITQKMFQKIFKEID